MPAPSAAAFTPSLSDVVLLDTGASTLRLWSPSLPRPLTFPNFIGRCKSTRTPYTPTTFHTCKDLGGLHIRLPFERGHIVDWPALKIIWDDVFSHLSSITDGNGNGKAKTKTRLLEAKTLVLTEPYFNFHESEEALDTILFEEYGVKAVWRCTSAQLAEWDDVNAFNPNPTAAAAARKTNEAALTPDTPHVEASTSTTATATSAPAPAPAPTKKTRSRPSTTNSAAAAAGPPAKRPRLIRPDCTLVVDLGFSYTHCVPLIRHVPIWSAVRRLDLGGKLLTNLLKETLSFRQWDMMDETYLTNVVKERCCFVAAEAGCSIKALASTRREKVVREMVAKRPSQWTFAELVEYSKGEGGGRIRQEWKLPDYETVPRSEEELVGFVKTGPGSQEEKRKVEQEVATFKAEARDESDLASPSSPPARPSADDTFIATLSSSPLPLTVQRRHRSTSSSSGSSSSSSRRRREEPDQLLTLTSERFTIPESLFTPSLVGLDQAGLAELIHQSISALSDDDGGQEGVREMMWCNILLIGGGAKMVGLKARLERELNALKPTDIPVIVRVAEDPTMSPINGAKHLVTSPQTTSDYRFFRKHLVTRSEWLAKGTEGARVKFDSWSRQEGG